MLRNSIFKPKNDESGVVLILVLVISVVMMIFAVGMVALNASQAISTQHQIDRIKAEQLAKGAHWVNYMGLVELGTTLEAPPETLDGKDFSVSLTESPATGPLGSDSYQFTIQFNQ